MLTSGAVEGVMRSPLDAIRWWLDWALFSVLEVRRTFLRGASLLVWARKDAEA